MALKKLFLSTAKKYKKLSPELKIPTALLLFILLIIIRLQELSKIIIQNLQILFQKVNKIFHKRKRFVKHIVKLRATKNLQRKKQYAVVPLVTKFKYFSLGIFISLFFVFLPLVFLLFLQDLPNPQELSLQQIPQTTKIYDRNKTLLYEIYTDQNRTIVPLNEIPVYLREATLAIEDKNFYKHPGFDVTSIIRALGKNLAQGEPIQGGSTITQQLIKSTYFSNEKTIYRKIKEIVLAFWTEHIYTKDQILSMYFNQVPYGGTAWGIEAASEVYFGKHVKQLSLAESAFLAGLTQAPTEYSPYNADSSNWKTRQKEVLSRMVALGYISDKQAKLAANEALQFKQPREPLLAPHFVMYVKDLLIQKYGLAAVEKGGLSVITSLDLKKQQMAEKIVKQEVDNDNYLNLTNGAALITDPKNGDILAMVGSKDFHDPNGGNFNVTTSPRQPGSTIKVVTYSAALLKGMTPATMLDDTPATFYGGAGAPPYSPVDYNGSYFGRVTLRFALGNSLNLPAVKTLQQVGIPTMVNLAKQMGITHWGDPSQYGLSITLGSAEATMLDMATVFGTLSDNGQRVDLNPLLSVTDSKGNVLEQKKDIQPIRVLPEGIAYIMSDILSDNQTKTAVFGPNSALVIPNHKVSVKTGTTDNKRDNWTIGYTNHYVVTVWVGNNDNSPMNPVLASGITGAAPIWHNIVVNLLGNTPDTARVMPSDVIAKSCYGKTEYFYKGTENSVLCNTSPVVKLYSAQQ